MASGFHSRRKVYFQIVLVVFILSLLGLVFFKVYGFFLHQKITDQKVVLSGQNTIVESYKSLTGYNKLQAVKLLEDKQSDVQRSQHISQVIAMLEDIKKVQSNGNDSVVLSDFKVTLDTISLKGKVSDLSVLYATSNGATSLFDRFSQLDFIKDIRVQTYDRVGDAGYFTFVLEANIVDNGTTK